MLHPTVDEITTSMTCPSAQIYEHDARQGKSCRWLNDLAYDRDNAGPL